MSLEFSPYYLKRSANKGSNFDNSLDNILILQKELDTVKKLIFNERDKIEDYLFTRIKETKDENKRISLLNFKRNVHNLRIREIERDFKSISVEDQIKANSLVSLHNRQEKLINQMHTVWDDNLKKNREIMQYEIESNENFTNGILMSNEKIFNNLEKYMNLNLEYTKPNKKERNTELGLKNYFNRMTKKPSPFSTFTDISLFVKNFDDYHVSSINPICRLNELVLKIIEQELLKSSDLVSKKYIAINPTIYEVNNKISRAISVGLSNPKYLYYREQAIELKLNGVIKDIICKLREEKNLNLIDFLMYLNDKFSLDEASAQKLVDRLISTGLIYINFNVPDQSLTLDVLIEIIKFEKKYQPLKRELENLQILIAGINREKNSIENKRKIRKLIFNKTNKIFSLLNLDIEELNIEEKSIIYENSINPRVKNYNAEDLFLEKEDIFRSVKLLRIFDDNLIEKIAMRIHFLDVYGIEKNPNAIEFFESYSKCNQDALWKKVSADNTVKLIKQLRIEFLEFLKKQVSNHSGENNIIVSRDWIDAFLEKSPDILSKWKSFSVYIQKQKNDLILNNVGPGYGRHFFRYCTDIAKVDQQKIMNIYRENISRLEKKRKNKLVDIGTTLGLNINLHPSVLSREVVYPGAIPSKGTTPVYPNEMSIRFNEETGNVELFLEKEEHSALEVTPIGFLFPMLAPSFYKYLCAFSYSNGVEVSIWDRYESLFEYDINKVCHYPNIYIGNVLLERETWKIDSSIMEDFIHCSNNEPTKSYILLKESLFNIGLKESSFFAKISKDIDALLTDNMSPKDWIKEISNTRFRKPQYYDSDNALDLMNFKKILNSNSTSARISLQSLYPNNKDVEEYLFELNEV